MAVRLHRPIGEARGYTYLCTPITEVVQGDDLPSARPVEVGEEGTDDRAPEVADVERLCDVGRGVLDDDALALAERVRAVLWLF